MSSFMVGDWRVEPGRNIIARNGLEVHLEPRVMDLLVYFAERPREVLSRDQIARDVWPGSFVGDSAIATAISTLRKAFRDPRHRPQVLETIPKRGYRLIASSSIRAPLLAVLPLRNTSQDPDGELFALGLTEALTRAVGRIPRLRVIAYTSAAGHRSADKPLRAIAADLSARLLLTGSIALRNKRIAMTLRLVDAAEERDLWLRDYEADVAEVISLQREIAHSVAGVLSDGPRVEEGKARRIDPDALTAYLRGRFHWWKWSAEHLDRALEYFEEAVRIDPDYGAAHAGIADVWGAYAYHGIKSGQEVRAHALEAARKAVEVDPASPEAHMLMGMCLFAFERDWAGAEAEMLLAITLNPNLGHARILYALLLATLRRPRALDEIDLAVRLDPLNPGALLLRAWCLAARGRNAEAADDAGHLLEIDPVNVQGLQLLADLAWSTRDATAFAKERAAWRHDAEISAILMNDALGRTQALAAAADHLIRRSGGTYVSPLQTARLLGLAGRDEEALTVLEQSFARGELIQADILQLSPAWDALRRQPRFEALRTKLGLEHP